MVKLARLARLALEYYEEFVDALRDYEAGRERIYAVERLAQLVAQSILDYAAILASRESGVKPETYRDLAKWLSQRLKLEGELGVFLEELAGFRNILVHMYGDLDRDLELEAFHEIVEKTPKIIEKLASLAEDDPCLAEIAPRLREIAKKLGFRYVLVFGSLARQGCGRDVDIAVRLGLKPRSMLEIGRLQLILESELGAPVDLVVLDIKLDPVLAKTIIDEGVLVYGDREEMEKDLIRLYKLYLDWKTAQTMKS